MVLRPLPLAATTMLWCALYCTPAAAQLGFRALGEGRFGGLPTWEAPAGGAPDRDWVDLRAQMPPVVDQGATNEAVAWAVAYAFKSYQEGIDQGWRLTARTGQMSAAWVLRRLVGKKDEPVTILAALALLEKEGCPTRATMPDGLRTGGQITDAARREAQRYRIQRLRAVRDRATIRAALLHGYPVVIGVVVDPILRAGRFDVFDRDSRRRAEKRVPIPQKDRGTAMTLVGFDDHRRAFLAMSSWGKGWADGGFGWLSYDLFGQVPNASPGDASRFVVEAYIAQDARYRYGRRQHELPVVLDVAYVGTLKGKPTWRLRAHIDAGADVLKRVESVDWNVLNGRTSVLARTSRRRASGYRLEAYVPGPIDGRVRATVRLRGGGTTHPNVRLRLDRTPARQRVELSQSDRYWGRHGGTSRWRWTVRLAGDLLDIGDVDEVRWTLGRGFDTAARIERRGVEDGFSISGTTSAGFEIKARLRFKDGKERELRTTLRFSAQVRGLALHGKRVRLGTIEGRPRHGWIGWVDGPTRELGAITRVRYSVPAGASDHTRQALQVTVSDRRQGFQLTRVGSKEFVLDAIVERDGKPPLRLRRRIAR